MEAYCFRCKKSYTEYPALSRRDNKTAICSACGSEEGINDYQKILDIRERKTSTIKKLKIEIKEISIKVINILMHV